MRPAFSGGAPFFFAVVSAAQKGLDKQKGF